MDDLADSKSEVLKELAKGLKTEAFDSQEANVEKFAQMEAWIKSQPNLLKAFRSLQKRFASDDSFREATNQPFMAAVELMDLGEEE